VLFRLYRNKKECERRGDPYRKKTELGRELVELAAQWVGERTIHLATDAGYCNDTLMRDLTPRVTVFGAMRPDAVLTKLPTKPKRPQAGRRRIRGDVLPKPEALARNTRQPWQSCKAELYGRTRTVQYKTIVGQWYHVCRAKLVRVVVVRVDDGDIDIRVFVCTDPAHSVVSILETYAERWALEVAFRDLKQHLGFADSSARKRNTVERMAPFVGYTYCVIVLWFADGAWSSDVAVPPIRPWYRTKRGHSFADILRAAQRALDGLDVLDPGRSLDKLPETAGRPTSPERHRRSNATQPQREAA
jgi:hypothetical protein